MLDVEASTVWCGKPIHLLRFDSTGKRVVCTFLVVMSAPMTEKRAVYGNIFHGHIYHILTMPQAVTHGKSVASLQIRNPNIPNG